MLLELKNVSKSYGENKVLDRVSLCLDRGKSVAVVAPSGTGKSTLLSIAGLLLTPNGGDVLFDGVSTACLTDNERSRLRAEKIGFLFQHTQLVGTLRAWENVSIGLDFLSQDVGRKEAERMAQDLLTSFGLEDRMFHYPHQLSVGQKRRVATARALVGNPSLIIADEPTNDLDAENAVKVCTALFDRVKKGSAALLLATHDLDLAEQADTVFELQ